MRSLRTILNGAALSLVLTNSTFAQTWQNNPMRVQVQADTNANVAMNTVNKVTAGVLNSAYNEFLSLICGSAPNSAYCVTPSSPTNPNFGAVCNANYTTGAGTDDSAAFNKTILVSRNMALTSGDICAVENLVIADNQEFDCHGAILIPSTGTGIPALWVLKKTGYNSTVRNCVITDPFFVTLQKTTLTQAAAFGGNVVNVTNAANFASGMIFAMQMDSKAWFVSKILAVNTSSNTITIADNIPYSITGATASGGTGYSNGVEVTLLGGLGPPATGHITSSGGTLTAIAIDTPGFYFTSPGAAAAVFDPIDRFAFSGVVAPTYGTASTGNTVEACFGVYSTDNANGGASENISIGVAPCGVQIANTGALPYNGNNEHMSHIHINAAQVNAFAKMVNVNDTEFFDIVGTGTANGTSAYGASGFYIDGKGGTVAGGGSKYTDVNMLGFETGWWDNGGALDKFVSIIADTERNYGFVCNACFESTWQHLDATFTGPNAKPALGSIGGGGVGMYFGSNAANNNVEGMTSHDNGVDMFFGDQISTVWIGNLGWTWSKTIGGFTDSIRPGYQIISFPPTGTMTGTNVYYVTPTTMPTTEGLGVINSLQGSVTEMFVQGSVAPGASTIHAFMRINPYTAGTYGGFAGVIASCSWTGTATGCLFGSGSVGINAGDQIDIEIAVTGGSYPSNEQITAYMNGL